MNNKMFGVMLLLIAGFVMADYVKTTIYFVVPAATSFKVTYLDGGFNNSEVAFPPSTVGASYYLNSSTGTSTNLQPCAGDIPYAATDVRCQNGVGKPFMIIENTGTVNEIFRMRFGAALPSGVLTCINGTKFDPAGSHTVKSDCIKGDLNESAWVWLASSVGTAAPNNKVNVTLWANFTAVAGGTSSQTLYTMSNTT